MATSVTHEPDVLEREVNPTLPASMSAGVDVQVATAKRFPRSIEAFVRRCKEMATLDAEVAASCVYALPRDGKQSQTNAHETHLVILICRRCHDLIHVKALLTVTGDADARDANGVLCGLVVKRFEPETGAWMPVGVS